MTTTADRTTYQLPTVKEYIDAEITRRLEEEKVTNPTKAWIIDTADVITASAYTSDDATLEDVVRKLVKTAARDFDLHNATSFVLQANWQEGEGEGSYFTGTATIVR